MKVIALALLILCGCSSYQLSHGKRTLPGGYDRVAIPMFMNKTLEVGIESYFTQSLRTEFVRSGLAKVTTKNDAQVILVGVINQASTTGSAPVYKGSGDLKTPHPVTAPGSAPNPDENPLPEGTVLNKAYATSVSVTLTAKRVSDNSVLWEGGFSRSQGFSAPLIGTPSLTGSNAIYIHSAKQDIIINIAKDLMSEAHDRLMENF